MPWPSGSCTASSRAANPWQKLPSCWRNPAPESLSRTGLRNAGSKDSATTMSPSESSTSKAGVVPMGWPWPQDYNEAVQNPCTSFSDLELRDGQPILNPLGLPIPRSGNFADVYEFVCPATQTRWAVKCFTRQVAGLRERYSEISRHLQDARLPFTVDFQYLEQRIRIRGQWYPILKMRWVEGLLL